MTHRSQPAIAEEASLDPTATHDELRQNTEETVFAGAVTGWAVHVCPTRISNELVA